MGESISSGVLAKWHVADGDTVKAGQALFELETDKITSEGTAETNGRISLKVEAGAEVTIGQVVATIDPADAGAAPAPKAASPAAAIAGGETSGRAATVLRRVGSALTGRAPARRRDRRGPGQGRRQRQSRPRDQGRPARGGRGRRGRG
jgi:2-oxoglutarate dehydrogenase E2 component (dihydrolipoamide succinyltransferase)